MPCSSDEQLEREGEQSVQQLQLLRPTAPALPCCLQSLIAWAPVVSNTPARTADGVREN